LVGIPPVFWPVEAGQDFSIFSSGGNFVQRSKIDWWYTPLGMVLITPVKFGWNPTRSFTSEGRTRFFYFQLWQPFYAAKQTLPVTCTTRHGTDHSCNVWLNSRQKFALWRADKIVQFLDLVAAKLNVTVIYTTRDVTDYPCKVWLKSHY
jgi:hypothetical protein